MLLIIIESKFHVNNGALEFSERLIIHPFSRLDPRLWDQLVGHDVLLSAIHETASALSNLVIRNKPTRFIASALAMTASKAATDISAT